jgi:hypothetical protein
MISYPITLLPSEEVVGGKKNVEKGTEHTATPAKLALSSRNLFVPLIPSSLLLRSQHPPPLTVRIKKLPSAPKLTKLGASPPPPFQVVFQASWDSRRARMAFSRGGGRLDQEAEVLSWA